MIRLAAPDVSVKLHRRSVIGEFCDARGRIAATCAPSHAAGGAQHVSSRHEKIKNWLHEISNNYVDYKFNRKGELHFLNFHILQQ